MKFVSPIDTDQDACLLSGLIHEVNSNVKGFRSRNHAREDLMDGLLQEASSEDSFWRDPLRGTAKVFG